MITYVNQQGYVRYTHNNNKKHRSQERPQQTRLYWQPATETH